MNIPLELLTTAEMAQADKLAVEAGVESLTLMENAGRAVAAQAARMAPAGSRIAVLCGPGNNGGDGFVAARYLASLGFDVVLALLGYRDALKGDAAHMASLWRGTAAQLTDPESLLGGADLVIDALFGAGLSRPLTGEAAAAVLHVNEAGIPVLAVDVPSGLDGTTGEAHGPAIVASRTITFFRLKPGHLLMPGRSLCGTTVLADIGIPPSVLKTISSQTIANAALTGFWRTELMRDPSAHKYSLGHAVVISGPPESTGAARLAVRGAQRVGAGLVSIASSLEAVAVNAAHLTAAMVKPVADLTDLTTLLADPRINALVVGPGAGVGAVTRRLCETALRSKAAVVLDADALTSYEAAPENLWLLIDPRRAESDEMLPSPVAGIRPRGAVLTPHEGEFRRLFPDLATGSKVDRARAAAARSGAVVVLKGPDTVIAAPRGTVSINENAPPWLATAGSGDVLAGMITGLLAQGLPAFHAACCAVWLHGACAERLGPGLIAEDLAEALPQVMQRLFEWAAPK